MNDTTINSSFQNALDDFQTDLRNPHDLMPHPANPRTEIDADDVSIQALAADIARRGILEPLVVTEDGYVLCGHRRRVASIVAGLEFVPVVIRRLRPDEFAEDIFLSENGHRANLSVLEEARAIAALRDKLSAVRACPNSDLARRLNMNPTVVGDRLAILELPERVRLLFHRNELPLSSSRQLLRLKDMPGEIEKFADRLVTNQITGKSLATLIDRRLNDVKNLKFTPPRTAADRGSRPYTQLGETAAPMTRKSAVEMLKTNAGRKISLFNIGILLDAVCCHCGMRGSEEVCGTCPLPKFVSGIAGRSEAEEAQW